MTLSNISVAKICSRRLHIVSIRSTLSPASLRQSIRPCSASRKSFKFAHTPPTFGRSFATESTTSTPKAKTGTIQISTLFTGLLIVGIGITAYGVYDFYKSFAIWPPEIRADLRSGIKARNQGDLQLSEQFLRRAYETALSLQLTSFTPSPYLKLSGIATTLASVLELAKKPSEAYTTYASALHLLQSHAKELNDQERLRMVALASKLGEMAEEWQLGNEEEERWLMFAVEEGLRVARDVNLGRGIKINLADEKGKGKGVEEARQEEKIVLEDLQLPGWLTAQDLGAPIEALGAFYARTGRVDYAAPLYLQAISLLIPTPQSGNIGSPSDICRGAQLMTSLSELLMRTPTPEKLHQAEAWASQALGLIEKTQKQAREKESICEQALAVALFNLGSIREMREDLPKARELFERSLEQSKTIGLREGLFEAKQALRRLDRLQNGTSHRPVSPLPSNGEKPASSV
ncbi:uncharacterized protein STEHIDRAFT_94126 [Stereum hirsutum FP-91666 SS1]|uniref:uncharacterized protein n=1 Tax=Stereum hirsutum (strain FP-91666) TaxID=721885 RepID=UPI000440BB37|nr:uncharacterized protein STEHIDRAFT_94126 [Stereum hirsutum FP-91666 SS1]EIM89060.1 hypothetical protein STEHIDRAFT_94126 [Stereum hirsutum FP-91666 SS1]